MVTQMFKFSYKEAYCSVYSMRCDQLGGPPCCFSKLPHSRYARIATSQLFLVINMFTCCCVVVIHLFPLYTAGNRSGVEQVKKPLRKHHFKSSFKNSFRWPPGPTQCAPCIQCSLSPSYHLTHHSTQGKHCSYQK